MKTGLDLVTCRESLFEDINIEGPWVSTSATVEDAIGIKMSSLSSIVGTMQNTFRNVKVTGSLDQRLFTHMTNLKYLVISGASLSGEIPDISVGRVLDSSLKLLALVGCGLSGPIPRWIGPWCQQHTCLVHFLVLAQWHTPQWIA